MPVPHSPAWRSVAAGGGRTSHPEIGLSQRALDDLQRHAEDTQVHADLTGGRGLPIVFLAWLEERTPCVAGLAGLVLGFVLVAGLVRVLLLMR